MLKYARLYCLGEDYDKEMMFIRKLKMGGEDYDSDDCFFGIGVFDWL